MNESLVQKSVNAVFEYFFEIVHISRYQYKNKNKIKLLK